MINKDNLVVVLILVGFFALIGLIIENKPNTTIAYGLLTTAIVAFGLGLYFTDMSKIDKKPEDDEENE